MYAIRSYYAFLAAVFLFTVHFFNNHFRPDKFPQDITMFTGAVPDPAQLSESVQFEASSNGGHIGFLDGGTPWSPTYYLPARIIGFLDRYVAESGEFGRALPGL